MPTYTDIDNTGAPAVPDLRDDYDRREWLDESALSHRLAPGDECGTAPRTTTTDDATTDPR